VDVIAAGAKVCGHRPAPPTFLNYPFVEAINGLQFPKWELAIDSPGSGSHIGNKDK